MFKLPEITNPCSIDTLGKMLAYNHELHVYCYECQRSSRVNLVMLARKLGMDHSCMHDDLIRKFYCPACRDAGRRDKNISFSHLDVTAQYSTWPRGR
jgi:hypothetical protein